MAPIQYNIKVNPEPELRESIQNNLKPGQTESEYLADLVKRNVDARADLAGAVNTIIALSLETRKRVNALYDEATLTIADIASRQGVTVQALYGAPWKLPGFGVPDHGKSPKRWKLSTYEAWMEIPEAERRTQWDTMSESERKKVLA